MAVERGLEGRYPGKQVYFCVFYDDENYGECAQYFYVVYPLIYSVRYWPSV